MVESKEINGTYSVKLIQEQDTKKVIRFISSYMNKKNKLEMSKKVFLSDQILNQECYNDINIRSGIYNYYEEYIVLEKEKEIIALIGLDINKNNLSKVLNLNLLICEENEIELLQDMFSFAIEILPEYSIIEPTKIRTYIRDNRMFSDYWTNILLKAGFIHEVTRKDEVGNGMSLTTMIIKMK
ncbi:hypothetical protein ACQPU1_12670 [Clostridium paraputrificum]|uniref:hypothetical protein n=1 Tax=Clostridium paraputrificum TaxID=29363 RepID=UPI003D34CE18